MGKTLKSKRILFFSPSFFGYEKKIKEKYESVGAVVDMFDERSITNAYQKALLKIDPYIFAQKTEKYYYSILEKIKDNKYDYVFFIKCEMATEKVLAKYREIFNGSIFCLYLWDSFENIPHIQKKLKYFDYVSSFDFKDCEKYNINFRPLFYCDDYKKEPQDEALCEYDMCFIGTIHSDRYKIIRQIEEQARKIGLSFFVYPYLQSRFIYYFYKFTKPEFRDTKITDFKFEKISSQDISKIVDGSRIIIDIQHPKQSGLTMRTFEVLGMQKKIITTNLDIQNYDFYRIENVGIIDRQNIRVGFELKKEYVKLEKDIYDKYSIEQWIYEVLECEK